MASPSVNITPLTNFFGVDATQPSIETKAQFYSKSNTQKLIDTHNRPATFARQMLTWRTPNLGYIQMYINPQQFNIQEKKIITPVRTKGGYVIQYAGEELINITLRGTTGSSGMEGINILRSVYRAEQNAFSGVAQSLETNAASAQLYALFNGTGTGTGGGIRDAASLLLEQSTKEAIFNIFDQPFPTLASLAVNVELFFQGVLYKGFFTSFDVEETADSPGLFNYGLTFIAYSREGTRRNFMPWHRQPYNPADSNVNPMSFGDSVEAVAQRDLANVPAAPSAFPPPPLPPLEMRDPASKFVDNQFQNVQEEVSKSQRVRDYKYGIDANTGKGLPGVDFFKNPPKIGVER